MSTDNQAAVAFRGRWARLDEQPVGLHLVLHGAGVELGIVRLAQCRVGLTIEEGKSAQRLRRVTGVT
jgi:hypothetical protein